MNKIYNVYKINNCFGLSIYTQDANEQEEYEQWHKKAADLTNSFLRTENRYNNFHVTTFARLNYNNYLICNISNPNTLFNNKIQYSKVNWAICVAGAKPQMVKNIPFKMLLDTDGYTLDVLKDNFIKIVQKKLKCPEPANWLAIAKFITYTKDPEKHKDQLILLDNYLNSKSSLKHEYTEEDIEKDFYVR